MGIGDVEPHVRSIQTSGRDGVSRLGHGHGFGVNPASADIAVSAHAVSVPTMGGRLSSARFCDVTVAVSGRSIANQYTVTTASIQLRAGVLR